MRTTLPSGFRRSTLATVISLAFASSAMPLPAQAVVNTGWIDWYAKGPGQVLGTIIQGSEAVQATFTGDYYNAFTDNIPEPYWGPGATYLGPVVDIKPPNSDIIVIGGGPDPFKLTFSQPLVNPILAIASLGQTNASMSFTMVSSMEFQKPFQVLSNGPNYYAGGRYTLFDQTGTILSGIESSGTIRFEDTLGELEWLSTHPEKNAAGDLVGTYIFTLGVNCNGYRLGPTPLTESAAVPAGCSAYNDRAFEQRAQLDVRGKLTHQGGGPTWLQAATLNVASGGLLTNSGAYTLGESQTLNVAGQLWNGGPMDVRGTLRVAPGGRVLNSSALFTLKGDNTFPEGGRLRVELGGIFTNGNTMSFEDGSRAEVAGVLDNVSTMNLTGNNAQVEVLPTGLLSNSGVLLVSGGGLKNRGQVRVESGGSLTFQRDIEFAGQVPLLDNQGTVMVGPGGSLHVEAGTTLRHGQAGTLQVDGLAQLDGRLENAGLVRLGGSGELRVISSNSFAQIASGSLQSAGVITLMNQGGMELAGMATVTGAMHIDYDARLHVLTGGNLVFAPGQGGNPGMHNRGTVLNQGSLSLASGAAENAFHENDGTLDNRGLFRIGANAALISEVGSISNSGRFIVDPDGLLAATAITQSDTGVFVNNGRVVSFDAALGTTIYGGRVSGSGTFDVAGVEFGDLDFDSGNSPGTLTFTGDLRLNPGVTMNMEFTENDGGDRVVVAGQFLANGATMRFLFPDGTPPGIDQVFTFLETPGGLPGDLIVRMPEGYDTEYINRGASDEGSNFLGVAFATPGASRLFADEINPDLDIWWDGQRYIQGDNILRPDAYITNRGTLGIRATSDTGLEVFAFNNMQGAALLNSATFVARDQFDNAGVVKNRVGAVFTSSGLLNNAQGGRFENRGSLRIGPDGQINNQGEFIVLGEVLDNSQRPGLGGPSIRNDGGRFEIVGSVRGQGLFLQQGQDAVTRVDGRLEAEHISIFEGVLSGSGVIVGDLSMNAGSRLEPGNSIGTLTVEGNLALHGADLLIEIAGPESHDRIVVSGNILYDRINFRLLDGYVPVVGEGWTWLQAYSMPVPDFLPWRVEIGDANGGGYYVLADANGIYDNQGLLPTGAYFQFTGDRLALVAAPVPEPGTWAMLLAGLGVLAGVVRRKPRLCAV